MQQVSCPSCGAQLTFRSKSSIFTVCEYCRSSVVRHDLDMVKIGEMAELPDDVSPIQIGTTGRYKNSGFYVAGRVIYNWENGTWNEWFLYFDNGKTGWLSEAQGEFAISFSIDIGSIPGEKDLSLHKKFSVGNDVFRVSDIKMVTYLGSEGELPFRAEKNYKSTVYDFSNKEHKFLTMEFPFNRQEEPMVYFGQYTKLAKLKPHNLRLFEGWT